MAEKVVALNLQVRKAKKITRDELAKQLGVSNVTIWAWETGRTLPNANDLYQMSKILGVRMEDLCQKESK